MGSKQLGFGDYEQATAKKPIRGEHFLAEMEKVVPWKALIEVPAMRRFAGINMISDRIPSTPWPPPSYRSCSALPRPRHRAGCALCWWCARTRSRGL
jgi:hypothetical protein